MLGASCHGPKIAHFKAFWELAWANMGERWLKIALNHLSTPIGVGTTLGEIVPFSNMHY